MRTAILGDHFIKVEIVHRVRPKPLQKRLRTLRLRPLPRIFIERILDNRMDRPFLLRRKLMREIAGAGGADGELGSWHKGRLGA